jgi:hypothetical protein
MSKNSSTHKTSRDCLPLYRDLNTVKYLFYYGTFSKYPRKLHPTLFGDPLFVGNRIVAKKIAHEERRKRAFLWL